MGKIRRFEKGEFGTDYIYLCLGIILTFFNVCVLIFTSPNIYPRYFEPLFAFYFMIASFLGVLWIYWGIKDREVYFEEIKWKEKNLER